MRSLPVAGVTTPCCRTSPSTSTRSSWTFSTSCHWRRDGRACAAGSTACRAATAPCAPCAGSSAASTARCSAKTRASSNPFRPASAPVPTASAICRRRRSACASSTTWCGRRSRSPASRPHPCLARLPPSMQPWRRVMPHPLPSSARAWQAKVRRFVDEELIPFEVEAEMTGGVLPEGVRQLQRRRAREIGLHALAIPKEHGGQGLTALEQTVIQEEIGRVTNALGWCYSSTPPWMLEACAGNEHQMKTWVVPNIRGERHECYAITEEHAGSDVDAIRAAARREGDHYVLNGEKWHVTSANHADHFIFQAKIADGTHAGNHALFFVDAETPGGTLV